MSKGCECVDHGNWHKWVWVAAGFIVAIVLVVMLVFFPGFKVDIHSHTMTLKITPQGMNVEDQVLFRSRFLSPTVIMLLNNEFEILSITQGDRKIPFMRVSSAVVIPSFAVRKDAQQMRTLTIKYAFSGKTVSNQYYEGKIGGRISEEAVFMQPEAFWYPTAKGDKCTMHIDFDLPEGWRAAFPGRQLADGSFVAEEPRMGYAFACAVYKGELGAGSVKVYALSQSSSSSEFLRSLENMLRHYQQALAEPYPFEILVAAEIPGLRHQLYGSGGVLLYDKGIAQSRALSDTARLAAAVGENWWSQRIRTAGSEAAWLSMSIPRYLALDYIQAQLGEREAALVRSMWSDQYLELLSREKAVSLAKLKYKPNSDVYHSTLNYRGPLVMSALQNSVGRNQLIKGLRAVIERYAHSTSALTYRRLCLELDKFSDRSTDALLSQWLQKEELPQLKLNDIDTASADGRFTVTGQITQNRPYFAMDVPITLITEEGNVVEKLVPLQGGKASFKFTVTSQPKMLVLDNGNTLLKMGRGHGPLTVNSFWQAVDEVTIVYPHDSAGDLATANTIKKRALDSGYDAVVVADRDLTAQQKQGYLVVVGWPAGFPYGGEDLPVKIGGGYVIYSGQHYQATEVGFAQVFANKLSRDKLVLHYYNLPTDFAPHGDAMVMLFDKQGVFLLDNPLSAGVIFSDRFSHEFGGGS